MSLVETSLADHVWTITLHDVEGRNALGPDLLAELTAALAAGEHEPAARVVVLTNLGSVFCAGADLRVITKNAALATSLTEGLVDVLRTIRHSAKPYVGRISGHCVGGGVGLAAVLDLSIASETATFGFSEVRLGVAPAVISIVCLAKMREGDARAVFLRGQRFDAREAARLGLITTSVASTELDGEVERVLDDLLRGEPHALALTKRLVTEQAAREDNEAFAAAVKISAGLFSSERALEGVDAFLARRPAPWVVSRGDGEN